MTNLKLSNSDSAYSICLVKFYENCYFLDNHNIGRLELPFGILFQ